MKLRCRSLSSFTSFDLGGGILISSIWLRNLRYFSFEIGKNEHVIFLGSKEETGCVGVVLKSVRGDVTWAKFPFSLEADFFGFATRSDPNGTIRLVGVYNKECSSLDEKELKKLNF